MGHNGENSATPVKAGFLAELRRRRVLPITGAYIAIAWLVTEIAGFLLEQAGAPPWSLRLLAIVFVVGFPAAVALAWVIQLQPDGKRAFDPSLGQGRIVMGVIALALLVTAGLAWLILPRIEDTPAIPEYQPLPNSVAVLPLADDRSTPNSRAIGEILYDALLHGLGQSRELAQIHLKLEKPPADLTAFGRRVRASTLLSGRLQAVRGGYRITMELLDVARGAFRWSRTVEWDPTRLMEIGTDFANGVLGSMSLPQLSTDRFAGTENRDAYDALLLGFHHQRSHNIVELKLAMDDFQRAIDLDPGYVDAHLGLAQTIFMYLNYKSPAEDERRALKQRQRTAVDAALAIDENNAEVVSLLGMLTENHELQLRLYERALQLDPHFGHGYFRLGNERLNAGEYEEAERLIRRALEFHPMSANYHSDLGSSLWRQGRYEEGRAEIRKSIELEPRQTQNYVKLGAWEWSQFGNIDQAIYHMRTAYSLDPEAGRVATWVASGYRDLSLWNEARAWVERGLALSPTSAWTWVLSAVIHRGLGDEKTALAHFRQALEQDPANHAALGALASAEIAEGKWEQALKRWRQSWPELARPAEPLVGTDNLGPALLFAGNLLESGESSRARKLLDRCLAVASAMPLQWEGDYFQTAVHVLLKDREKALAGIRKNVLENRQYAEPAVYLGPEYDFLRQDPEFKEVMAELNREIAAQREHVLEMERNGEMPPAPGVSY